MLLSPDLDNEVFAQRIAAKQLHNAVDSFSIYSSADDQAIRISEFLLESTVRIGRISPNDFALEALEIMGRMPGLSIVHSRLSGNSLGHSNFQKRPEVSSDLILLLRDGRKPGAENERPLERLSGNFWNVSAGYPKAND